MALEHAILGFLNYHPLSGYDLKAAFDASVRHFWPADQSRIYRTLAHVTEQGWAQIEVVEQDVRPDRKVYHITESGRSELLHWLATPPPHKATRIPELVQIFFAAQLPDEEILVMLHRMADHLHAEYDKLCNLPDCKEARPPEAPQRDSFFWWLTLDYGMTMMRANLAWFDDVIARVERGEHLVVKSPQSS